MAEAYLTVLSAIPVRASCPQTLLWEPVVPDSRRPPSPCTQPYLQRTASLSGRASYTHKSPSSSFPVATAARPRSSAAAASLMVQPMGTWKGRNLQSCRALCRGCPSHPQPLPQGPTWWGESPLLGREKGGHSLGSGSYPPPGHKSLGRPWASSQLDSVYSRGLGPSSVYAGLCCGRFLLLPGARGRRQSGRAGGLI